MLAYGSLDMHVYTIHIYPVGYVVNLRIMPTIRMHTSRAVAPRRVKKGGPFLSMSQASPNE